MRARTGREGEGSDTRIGDLVAKTVAATEHDEFASPGALQRDDGARYDLERLHRPVAKRENIARVHRENGKRKHRSRAGIHDDHGREKLRQIRKRKGCGLSQIGDGYAICFLVMSEVRFQLLESEGFQTHRRRGPDPGARGVQFLAGDDKAWVAVLLAKECHVLFGQPIDGKGEHSFRGRPDGNRPRSAEFGKSALDRDLARITKGVLEASRFPSPFPVHAEDAERSWRAV